MLDVVMGCGSHELGHAIATLTSLEEKTDVPWRPIVCADGATRNDLGRIDSYLRAIPNSVLLRNVGSCYGSETLRRALVRATAKYVAVISPSVVVDDPRWFGKMQMPFEKDGLCGMVIHDTTLAQPQAGPYPVKRTESFSSRTISLLSRRHMESWDFGEPVTEPMLASRFFKQGSSVWFVPNIRARGEVLERPIERDPEVTDSLYKRWQKEPEVIL